MKMELGTIGGSIAFINGERLKKPAAAPLPIDALPKLTLTQGEEHQPAVDAPEATIEQELPRS